MELQMTKGMPKGFKHTEEAKTKIREARAKQKMYPRSDETRSKISAANKGKKWSAETRAKHEAIWAAREKLKPPKVKNFLTFGPKVKKEPVDRKTPVEEIDEYGFDIIPQDPKPSKRSPKKIKMPKEPMSKERVTVVTRTFTPLHKKRLKEAAKLKPPRKKTTQETLDKIKATRKAIKEGRYTAEQQREIAHMNVMIERYEINNPTDRLTDHDTMIKVYKRMIEAMVPGKR